MTQADQPSGAGVLTWEHVEELVLIRADPPLEPLYNKDSPAAYDLRVGHIVTPGEYLKLIAPGEGHDSHGFRRNFLILKPGETATLATLESVDLRGQGKQRVTALIIPRNKYALRGLLTLNAGHVDPGHKGFVTAQVINLTNQGFPVHLEESYFSIVFSFLTRQVSPRKELLPDDVRIRELIQQAEQAPVSLVQKETLKEVFVSKGADFTVELVKRVSVFALGLAAIAGAVFAGIQLLD